MINKKMFKKFIVSTLLAVFLLTTIFVPFAKAQTWHDQSFQDWYAKVYDDTNPTEIFGERYTAAQVQWVIYGFWAFMVNSTTNKDIVMCFLTDDAGRCVTAVTELISSLPENSNLAKGETSLWKLVFAEKSFSGITYVKERARNLKLIPEAQAQGFGFGALDPVQDLWRAARDISYTLFVLIAVIFAFMIMFRVKISPQVVITVQSALPKLIIALILVTFSYAIAGFLVDLVYVVIGLFSLLFDMANISIGSENAYEFLIGESLPGGIFGYFLGFIIIFTFALLASLFAIISPLLILPFTSIFSLIALIAFIVLLLVIIINTFKVIWMLFKTVATVYLLTIIGPLQITLGALTNQGGFGSWLKQLAANLAVFPAVGVLFYLAYLFLGYSLRVAVIQIGANFAAISIVDWITDAFGLNLPSGPQGWSPPFLGLAGQGTALIFAMTGLVIITMIPKVSDMIKAVIEGKPFAYGTSIGEAAGPVIGAASYMGRKPVASGVETLSETDFIGRQPVWVKSFLDNLSRRLGK